MEAGSAESVPTWLQGQLKMVLDEKKNEKSDAPVAEKTSKETKAVGSSTSGASAAFKLAAAKKVSKAAAPKPAVVKKVTKPP
jgi:hypothetical protein